MNKQQGTGGDMQNTWKIFSKAMKKIGISLKEFRVHALKDGDPTECTRLLRLVLMGISLEVAEQMLSRGLGQLSSDSKFVNTAFRFLHHHNRYLREQSAYIPVITTTQYHSKGFGEHKLLLIHAAANHVLGYLALGGPRVPSDIDIPPSITIHDPTSIHSTPSSTGDRRLSRAQSTPASTNSHHHTTPHKELYDFNFDSTHDTPYDQRSQQLPSSQKSQNFTQQNREDHPAITSPEIPATPLSPYDDPDASPNYRRAYRIESMNEDDTLTREEVVRLMHDMEKRLRREYDSAIFVLSNKIKLLEDELHKVQHSSHTSH